MKRSRYGIYRRQGEIFCFRWKDRNGNWHEKSTGETDRSAAERAKDVWDRDNVNCALPTSKGEWTVAEACTAWVEQHAVHLKSAKARKNERSYLRQLLRHLGKKQFKKLKAVMIDDLRDYQTARSLQVRERPVNLELGILVRTLKMNHLWRGDLRGLPEDPETGYKRLKEPESEVGEALTEKALMHLEAVARTADRWDVAYNAQLIAANTGMRGCEIKKLQLGKVDLVARSLLITRKATKTRAGRRQVELNQAAFAAVSRLYQRAQLLGASESEHYLLPADLSRHTRAGDPLKGGRGFDATHHQMSWNTAWRKLRTAAGMERLRFHNLRHTYISRMAELGVPLAVTQSAVGHISDAVTKHYTHISDTAARAAVEKLQEFRRIERNEARRVDTFVDARNEVESNLLN